MIRLTYSNRSETLLDALVEDLSAWRASGVGPLEPARVVVPNRNVEAWLKQGIARRTGLAANLEIHYLRRFVAGLLGEGAPLLDGEGLLDGILSFLLDEERLGDEVYAGLRAYLLAAGDGQAAVDNRRFQLALQLARLYEEYGYARPEMVLAWERGCVLDGTPYAEAERWQRRLWLDLLAAKGEVRTLPAVLEEPGALEPGEAPIFLFGISYVARAFHRILGRLAEGGQLYAYTLNPCREFWEDVETRREFARRLARRERVGKERLEEEDPFGLLAGDDTPALSLWGRPGRENIRLLNELADCDFVGRFEEPAGKGLLHRLQRDILDREPERREPDPGFAFDGDESLQVLACPGVRREAEAIAAEIWAMVQADPTLRFNEIAVLVAGGDAQSHFTHLRAAFEESYGIPYSLGDVPFSSESRVAEAVELLLQLPGGKFSRRELLRFLTHPAVGGRFAEARPEDWAALTERLGIFLGADREQFAESYLEEDLLSWDQGLRRLALGSFLGGSEPLALDGAHYLPEEGKETELAWAAQVRSLISDLRFARDARLRTGDWARFFEGLVRSYVDARGEAEGRELERCLRALRAIGELSLGGREIACGLAVQLALRELHALSGGKGHYLADGVVLSTLQPMRAIPFRAIFIAGLGEGRFPSVEKRSHLDLRLARPRAGDVSTRDGEQYMFLEALLCARERLVLSYVARDAQTGEELPPSPVVGELLRILERGYVRKLPVRRIALRRHDSPGPDRRLSPQALREGEALALRESLMEALGPEARRLSAREIVERSAPEVRERLAGVLRLHPVPRPSEEKSAEVPTLSLAALRRFLECPLQGSAQYVLRLEEDEEDLLDREVELFETPFLPMHGFLRERFFEALEEAGSVDAVEQALLEALYDRAARREVLAGRMPSGFFQRIERGSRIAWIGGWVEALREAGLEPVRTLRFGGSPEEGSTSEQREPIDLGIAKLVGKTEALVGDGGTTLLLLDKRAEDLRYHLRVFLTHLILAASGERPDRAHEGWLAHVHPGPGLVRPRFAPIGREEAQAYLRSLAEELLAGPHAYLLPCDAVFEWKKKEGAVPLEELVHELLHNTHRRCRSSYGPVRDFRSFPPLPEAEALAAVERRFGLFFEKLVDPWGKK